MLVSVILPVFNEKTEFLCGAIDSILDQSYKEIELIIIDDSTDNACSDLINTRYKDSRITYIKTLNRLGLTLSLNYGCKIAKGIYIARMDSDDLAVNSRLEKQVEKLQACNDIDVLGTNIYLIDRDNQRTGTREYPTDDLEIQKRLHCLTPIAHPTVMFKKSLIEKYGGYNSDFPQSEDLELWLRWSNRGVKFENLQEYLLEYRMGSTQRENQHWKQNIRARLLNFSHKNLGRRVIGIMLLTVWLAIPYKLKNKIYTKIRNEN